MSLTIPDIQPAASTPADHASPARAPRKIPARSSDAASPPFRISISSEAKNLAAGSDANRTDGFGSPEGPEAVSPTECQTCSNRKYVDGSSDSTVSFQTPTRISPGSAETLVRAHEQEHVANEQVRAKEQGSRVVSQSVSIHYSICPECGRSYVAGGTTTTVTKPDGNEAGAAENSPAFPGLDVIA